MSLPANPLSPKKPLPPVADFSKIKGSPLVSQINNQPSEFSLPEDAAIQERREDRIKRENLLRYYEAEFSHAKRELTVVDQELKDLENKIRAEEKEIDLLEGEQLEYEIKLKRGEKLLHRLRFELRTHKGEEMEKRIVQRRWQDSVKESEAKLKKIKYGDWKALRK